MRARGTTTARWALAVTAAAVWLVAAAPASAAPAAAGHRDQAFTATSVAKPTGQKPQSKLWFTDGIWWGSIFDQASAEYHVQRFDPGTQGWIDTGTVLDARNSSHADTLWDGQHLYVASASEETADIQIMRLSYSPATRKWTRDAAYAPVIAAAPPVEAVVLDEDTTGRLWLTYTLNNAGGTARTVYVAHTGGHPGDVWEPSYALPVTGADDLSPDDISSLVAFGHSVGVMWSNQVDEAVRFATHADGAGDAAWVQEAPPLAGPLMADDHLNLKSVQAGADGDVYAVVKTSTGDDPMNSITSAQVVLLTRHADSGAWTSATFGTVADDHTRPIVMTDQRTRRLYVFATSPTVADGNQTIYYKETDLDHPAFAPGLGTSFMSGAGFDVNDASSTKQDLGTIPFALVVGSDFTNYWHNTLALDHPVVTPTPTPTATPTPTPTPTPPATTTTAPTRPVLTGLSLRPQRFRATSRTPRPARRLGTRIRFRLDRAARVTLTVQRRVGRRWVKVRGRRSVAAKAGSNRLLFGGRLRGRRLRAGQYRLVAVARADGLSSVPRRAGFRLLRQPRPRL